MTLTADSRNKTTSLVDICSQFVAENGQVVFSKNRNDDSFDCFDDDCDNRQMCNDDIILPVPVSESLFDAFRRLRSSTDVDDRDILEFFGNAQKTPLWNLNLYSSQVSDTLLTKLLREHGESLLSLNLTDCEDLTELINYHLNDVSAPKLHTMNLGSLVKLFGPWLMDNTELSKIDASMKAYFELESPTIELDDLPPEIPLKITHFNPIQIDDESSASTSDNSISAPSPRPILTSMCPNLLNFTLHGDQLDDIINADANVREHLVKEFFHILLQPLRNLVHLDLSYWSSMNDLSFLNGMNLHCLILYEVPELYKAIEIICNIKTLEHLDVSQSSQETGVYPTPATTLDRFVYSLPNLISLDITSTNLASNPTKGDRPPLRNGSIESDIVGLSGLPKRLEYLGIFLCDSASHYQRIPAITVAGDGSELQILVAIEKYLYRPALLVAVLNEAYQTYRFGVSVQHTRALHLMLDAMNIHLLNANIQIASSASIFYIIRNVTMNSLTKKKVIAALLNAMQHHMQEQTLVRNCCLSLCQFEVPLDILHDYERAVRLLLRVLQVFTDQMTQRIVIYLLNSLACHVDGQQKITVGNLGAVEVILEVINRRVEAGVCDEVMEVSWSFLWNITDETSVNCQKFLNNKGMELFQKCKETFPTKVKLLRNMMGSLKFPDRTELLRNMMGLMGNIAEVKELRSHLMESRFVVVFCELLNNIADGIEISYNSAGVLAHMISDGAEVWTFDQPTREEASACVVQAVQTWQLNAKRFINYRSFEPILRLLPLENSYAAQYWAVWALANLTTVDGPKYCSFIVDEHGVPLLQAVFKNPKTDSVLRDLARKVLQNVHDHKGLLVF